MPRTRKYSKALENAVKEIVAAAQRASNTQKPLSYNTITFLINCRLRDLLVQKQISSHMFNPCEPLTSQTFQNWNRGLCGKNGLNMPSKFILGILCGFPFEQAGLWFDRYLNGDTSVKADVSEWEKFVSCTAKGELYHPTPVMQSELAPAPQGTMRIHQFITTWRFEKKISDTELSVRLASVSPGESMDKLTKIAGGEIPDHQINHLDLMWIGAAIDCADLGLDTLIQIRDGRLSVQELCKTVN